MRTDKPKCHCGVFGIFNSPTAAINTYYGLHSLQHRGQEAAGIVSASLNKKGKKDFNIYKAEGLVNEVFNDKSILSEKLIGDSAIGHNRYSTTGSSSSKNIQPYIVNYRSGHLALAHNGNLTNAKQIREKLVNEGAIFQTTSDTEVILHLIARSQKENQIEQIKDALSQIEGAYCLTILTDDKLIAARDPHGFRPLAVGKTKDNAYLVASETCAFDINFASYIRDVEPGEILVIDNDVLDTGKFKSFYLDKKAKTKHCIFEYIYFSRPDSRIFENNVDKIRRKLGKILAKKHPVVDKDGEKVIVISVPDSSNTCAIGYQDHLAKQGINSKLEIGLIRSHYVGRTFILPGQEKREVGVRVKFNTVKGVLEGRTVVIVDDSIVRGTTMKQLVKLIKEANPKSIHLRISSAPILYPCYYGMDFPSREELIVNKFKHDIDKIREYFEVDSLEYMTEDEMLDAMVDQNREDFCTACFTGKYPTKVIENIKKEEYDD